MIALTASPSTTAGAQSGQRCVRHGSHIPHVEANDVHHAGVERRHLLDERLLRSAEGGAHLFFERELGRQAEERGMERHLCAPLTPLTNRVEVLQRGLATHLDHDLPPTDRRTQHVDECLSNLARRLDRRLAAHAYESLWVIRR